MVNLLLGIFSGFVITTATILCVAAFTRGMPVPKRLKIVGLVGFPVGICMSLLATYLGLNLF